MNHLGLKCLDCGIVFSESDLGVMSEREKSEPQYCDICAVKRFDYDKNFAIHQEKMKSKL